MLSTIRLQSIYTLIIVFLAFTSSATQAQEASLDGNVLTIPVLQVGTQFYRVQLALVLGSDPLELSLQSAEELTNASSAGASSFANNTLSVPSITYNGVSYSLQLALVGQDPITFRLISTGINEEVPSGTDSSSLSPLISSVNSFFSYSTNFLDLAVSFGESTLESLDDFCSGPERPDGSRHPDFYQNLGGGVYNESTGDRTGPWANCEFVGTIDGIWMYHPSYIYEVWEDGQERVIWLTYGFGSGTSYTRYDTVSKIWGGSLTAIYPLVNYAIGEGGQPYIQQFGFGLFGSDYGTWTTFDESGNEISSEDRSPEESSCSYRDLNCISGGTTSSGGDTSTGTGDDNCEQLGYFNSAGSWVSRCNFER